MEIELVRKETVRDFHDVRDALVVLRGMEIRTAEDQSFAADVLRDVKVRHIEVEERRKRITIPLNAALREVNDLFRPVREALEECERVLKQKIAGYLAAQVERNVAALDEAGEALTVIEAEEALARVEDVAPPRGVSVRQVWKFEVLDPDAVPREFCSPDPRKIGARGGEAIPGVRWFKEDVVAVRK